MSERPFMQLYVSDYLGDTRHLSCEQHGAYLLLLMTMWNAGGSLPDDDRKLARIVCLSVKKWKATRDDVLEFFEISEGVISHPKISPRGYAMYGRISLSAARKEEIFARDGHVCSYCGAQDGPFHVDHILPVALGGSNDPDNLTIACKACNLSKGAMPLTEWSSAQ